MVNGSCKIMKYCLAIKKNSVDWHGMILKCEVDHVTNFREKNIE